VQGGERRASRRPRAFASPWPGQAARRAATKSSASGRPSEPRLNSSSCLLDRAVHTSSRGQAVAASFFLRDWEFEPARARASSCATSTRQAPPSPPPLERLPHRRRKPSASARHPSTHPSGAELPPGYCRQLSLPPPHPSSARSAPAGGALPPASRSAPRGRSAHAHRDPCRAREASPRHAFRLSG
jgi:hypothetical protein